MRSVGTIGDRDKAVAGVDDWAGTARNFETQVVDAQLGDERTWMR